MSNSFSGKTAIVTGAARGVGLAIAREFVDRGANVMFADCDEARLTEALGQDAVEDGAVRAFAGDLGQKLAMANLLSATIDAFDRVDILVNANRTVATTDPLNPEDPSFDLMLRQNLMSSLRLSQMTAKRMIAQAEAEELDEFQSAGVIVNLTSLAAQRPQPELLAYSIGDAAIEQATRALAVAFASHRIRVNGVALGSVMTASLQDSLRENPDWRDTIADGTPLGRIAAPGELVEAVLFLASQDAGFITGQILSVDGGRSLADPVRVPAF